MIASRLLCSGAVQKKHQQPTKQNKQAIDYKDNFTKHNQLSFNRLDDMIITTTVEPCLSGPRSSGSLHKPNLCHVPQLFRNNKYSVAIAVSDNRTFNESGKQGKYTDCHSLLKAAFYQLTPNMHHNRDYHASQSLPFQLNTQSKQA